MEHSRTHAQSWPLDSISTAAERRDPDELAGRRGNRGNGSTTRSLDATRQLTGDRRPALEGLVVRWWVPNPCEVYLPRVAKCSKHGHRRLGVDQQTGHIVCYLCHPELNPHNPAFSANQRSVAPVTPVPRTPSPLDTMPRDPCPICVGFNYIWTPETEAWICDHGAWRKQLAMARRQLKATKRRQPNSVSPKPVRSRSKGKGMPESGASAAAVSTRDPGDRANRR